MGSNGRVARVKGWSVLVHALVCIGLLAALFANVNFTASSQESPTETSPPQEVPTETLNPDAPTQLPESTATQTVTLPPLPSEEPTQEPTETPAPEQPVS